MSVVKSDDQGYLKLYDILQVKMSNELRPQTAWIYSIILQQCRRVSKNDNSLTLDTQEMTFSYQDFKKYGIKEKVYHKSILELKDMEYLTPIGEYVQGAQKNTVRIHVW